MDRVLFLFVVFSCVVLGAVASSQIDASDEHVTQSLIADHHAALAGKHLSAYLNHLKAAKLHGKRKKFYKSMSTAHGDMKKFFKGKQLAYKGYQTSETSKQKAYGAAKNLHVSKRNAHVAKKIAHKNLFQTFSKRAKKHFWLAHSHRNKAQAAYKTYVNAKANAAFFKDIAADRTALKNVFRTLRKTLKDQATAWYNKYVKEQQLAQKALTQHTTFQSKATAEFEKKKTAKAQKLAMLQQLKAHRSKARALKKSETASKTTASNQYRLTKARTTLAEDLAAVHAKYQHAYEYYAGLAKKRRAKYLYWAHSRASFLAAAAHYKALAQQEWSQGNKDMHEQAIGDPAVSMKAITNIKNSVANFGKSRLLYADAHTAKGRARVHKEIARRLAAIATRAKINANRTAQRLTKAKGSAAYHKKIADSESAKAKNFHSQFVSEWNLAKQARASVIAQAKLARKAGALGRAYIRKAQRAQYRAELYASLVKRYQGVRNSRETARQRSNAAVKANVARINKFLALVKKNSDAAAAANKQRAEHLKNASSSHFKFKLHMKKAWKHHRRYRIHKYKAFAHGLTANVKLRKGFLSGKLASKHRKTKLYMRRHRLLHKRRQRYYKRLSKWALKQKKRAIKAAIAHKTLATAHVAHAVAAQHSAQAHLDHVIAHH